MSEERADRKIQEICDIITKETLTPAKEKAEDIIQDAKLEAAEIIRAANEESRVLLEQSRKEIEKEFRVAQSSIDLAVKQGLSQLRGAINELFRDELKEMFASGLNNEEQISKVIDAVVKAIDQSGFSGSLIAYIGKELDVETVQKALLGEVAKRLGTDGVQLGDLPKGVVLKQAERKFAVEVSDESLTEMLGEFLTGSLHERLYRSS